MRVLLVLLFVPWLHTLSTPRPGVPGNYQDFNAFFLGIINPHCVITFFRHHKMWNFHIWSENQWTEPAYEICMTRYYIFTHSSQLQRFNEYQMRRNNAIYCLCVYYWFVHMVAGGGGQFGRRKRWINHFSITSCVQMQSDTITKCKKRNETTEENTEKIGSGEWK